LAWLLTRPEAVSPSEAGNLSISSRVRTDEGFLASLGMTDIWEIAKGLKTDVEQKTKTILDSPEFENFSPTQ
jgi:hypothetical protein